MIILFKSGQSLALCGAHFIPAYTLNDKTNAIKPRCKFNGVILHFIVKSKSAPNFTQVGSSNLDVMFFHFQSSKYSCAPSLKISSSTSCVPHGHAESFPWSRTDARGERRWKDEREKHWRVLTPQSSNDPFTFKKSETELTASVLEKRSKTRKRLKERFLTGRNRTKRANFLGTPLFKATYNIKTEKQTINSTYLVSVGCGRLAEGKGHETDIGFKISHGSKQ